MTDCGIVLMTAASRAEAEKIADFLVEERLAACAQIFPPIRSIYWWEGNVCREDETFFTAKTTRDLFPRLAEAVKSLHSYKVPQIVFVPIAEGAPEYLEWLTGVVSQSR